MSARPQILILETSTAYGSIGIMTPDKEWHHMKWHSLRNHNLFVFGFLEELFKKSGVRQDQFDLILAGSGPGSYSGTRVGISVALGIGIASECPVVGIPSLAAIDSAEGGHGVLLVGDARRSAYWTANLLEERLIGGPELCDRETLASKIDEAFTDGKTVVSWEDPNRLPVLESVRQRIQIEYPDARGIWRTWQQASEVQKRTWSSVPPEPLYLMAPLITPSRHRWSISKSNPPLQG